MVDARATGMVRRTAARTPGNERFMVPDARRNRADGTRRRSSDRGHRIRAAVQAFRTVAAATAIDLTVVATRRPGPESVEHHSRFA